MGWILKDKLNLGRCRVRRELDIPGKELPFMEAYLSKP